MPKARRALSDVSNQAASISEVQNDSNLAQSAGKSIKPPKLSLWRSPKRVGVSDGSIPPVNALERVSKVPALVSKPTQPAYYPRHTLGQLIQARTNMLKQFKGPLEPIAEPTRNWNGTVEFGNQITYLKLAKRTTTVSQYAPDVYIYLE